MHLRTRTWFIISMLCLLGALIFWQLGERKYARDQAARQKASAGLTNAVSGANGTNSRGTLATPSPNPGPSATSRTNAAVRPTNSFPYRLSNTTKTVEELIRSEHSLLLNNAHIDSSAARANPVNLDIPPHLRAAGDPGSYIVQSRGPLTDRYRALLGQAGAEIVSYVPNNALLVRAPQAVAQQLAAWAQTQVVLPWEPYYKLDSQLLPLAVEQKTLPPAAQLTLLLFPGQREAALQALAPLKAVLLAEDRSPFGPQLRVRVPSGTLVALAQLPMVQSLELYHRRVPANDLSRARVLVSTNTTTASNFRGLDGAGVLVNVNDTGVEAAHVDLFPRVTGDSGFTLLDFDGHGTHVAGTIASSGNNGPEGEDVPGSSTNANYRGMAPAARIFALPIGSVRSPSTPDSYLQERPALTNALISNNSWAYNGAHDYTLAAASWDAAVRDAVPGLPGSQSLIAVFAAGNSSALGIESPATAKNVITVGAIKNMRYLTNEVVKGGVTNQPWLRLTDTNNEIAPFSSIGNVGRGREGKSGRFKPDVVAPGTFVVSTRAQRWTQPTNNTELIEDVFAFVRLRPGESEPFGAFLPENATQIEIIVVTNQLTGSTGLPPLPITSGGVLLGTNRAVVVGLGALPGIFDWTIENPGNQEVRFDVRYIITVTVDTGNESEVLYDLNLKLGPNYRYESGTSMAAPAVSGVLALMQQYYGQLGLTNSPALMKALVINGARSANDGYDFNVDSALNGQGWGLVALTNSLPAQESVGADRVVRSGTMVFYDQDLTRVLATGQSFTRTLTVASNSSAVPLRITLVWTDPPGNPSVGVKLVNDLDLIVTNLTTGQVYVGNAIGDGAIFTGVAPTNTPLVLDRVNNVENVYLDASFDQRLSGSYSVTVTAHRVNVNAVTADNTGTVQDFALVISSGNPREASAITVGDQPIALNPAPELSVVTNGVPLLNQRVGAQYPLDIATNGIANQWRFFIVTNELPPSDPLFGTAGAATNIAFTTFLPPNLSRPRFSEADIDLYVSSDPAITNLVPAVLDLALRSRKRTGTESVVIESEANGAVAGTIFYAAVKAEDQQSANFGFFAVSSSSPFGSQDTNGNVVINGYPINTPIPDGAPESPQAAFVFAFCTFPMVLQNVVVTNVISHENGGDLFGLLEHDSRSAVLNANRSFSGDFFEFVYDESDSGEIPFETKTDTPGSLRNFVGEEGVGVWQLTMVDSAPGFTGVVNRLSIRLEPRSEDLTNGVGIVETILPGRWFYTVVDVPADATNLAVCVAPENGILGVYILRGAYPNLDSYDTFGTVAPPGDCINLGRRDSPPLSQGRYFVGVYNPSAVPVTANIKVNIERDLARRDSITFGGGSGKSILDDAMTNATIYVPQDRIVADLQVAVRLEHERVADLILHLVSPSGTRVLLAENRGGPLSAGYGFGSLQTNVAPASSQGGARANTNTIGPVQVEGSVQIDYDFFGIPDRVSVYYDGVQIFDSGLVSGAGTFSVDYGPGTATNVVVVMNEGNNPNLQTAWGYTATVYSGYTYATFTEDTSLAAFPIKFSPAPFTNFNYRVVVTSTNETVLDDGFEAGAERIWQIGEVVSGWQVYVDDVETHGDRPFAPWFVAADSGDYYLDVNGTVPGAISRSLTAQIGLDYLVSFAYTRNAANSGATSAEVLMDSGEGLILLALTNNPGVWIPTSFVFTATSLNPLLQVYSTTFGATAQDDLSGVFFDSFKVQQVDTKTNLGIYFQPEESIAAFRGENSLGDWKLEIWDSRAGGSLTNLLLAWKLNLTFVNTNPPAIALTNGVTHCLELTTNATVYFRVDVPITASAATNLVVGSDDLDLIFNQAGEPFGTEPPDTFFLRNVPGGTGVLGLDGWNSYDAGGALFDAGSFPTIVPGKRYYLGVRNRAPTINNICITVTFDEISPNLVGIIPLTNFCHTVANPLSTNAGAITYYSFDASTNALGVRFRITGISDADQDLVVSRGLPLPTATSYLSNSFNTHPADEFIAFDDFWQTNLLGRWYLGAINTTGDAMAYTVCAEEIPGRILTILPNQWYRWFSASNDVQYFKVTIANNAFLADFVLSNLFTSADLYLSTNTMSPLFGVPTNALYAGTLPGLANENIRVSALSLTNPLTPGTWFLAVVNRDTTLTPTNYDLFVSQVTTNLPYVRLTNGIAYADYVEPTDPVGLYRFTVAPDALQVVFEVYDMDEDMDLFVRFNQPLPPPSGSVFTFASTNLYPENEFLCLRPNDPVLLRPGNYFMTVRAKGGAGLTGNFKIRATQIISSDVTQLVNGEQVCQNVPPLDPNALYTGVHFFAINVPRSPIQATFDLVPGIGDVDMYIQKDLPLTNFTTYVSGGQPYPYPHELPGLANEYRHLTPADGPVALSQGTWYVSVVNRSPFDADYCFRASWLAPINLTRLRDGIPESRLLEQADGGPILGVNYYVFNVPNNAGQVVFDTLQADGNVDLYVTRTLLLTNSTTWNPATYPYSSTRGGATNELIYLDRNSTPLALAPGDWYVAVVNREPANSVIYTVRATQSPGPIYVTLTNNQVHCSVVGPAGGIQYYQVLVTNNPALTLFESFSASGDIDLYVSLDPNLTNLPSLLPLPPDYPYASTNQGLTSECVTLNSNSLPVALSNGAWYVAVVNRDPEPVSYCFRSSSFTNFPYSSLGGDPTNACGYTVAPTNSSGTIGVDYYSFTIGSNVLQAKFALTTLTGNADLYLAKDFRFLNRDTFPPGFVNADYASETPGAADELICISSSSQPVGLAAGEWFLAVVNREATGVDYCVAVDLFYDTNLIALTNRVPYTPAATIAPAGVDYYRYRVSPGAVQVTFEILQPTENVDLYVDPNLCSTSPIDFSYVSANPGDDNELIRVARGSAPAPLTGGDWFMAVVSSSVLPVTYTVRVTEILASQIIRLTNGVPYTNTVVGVGSVTDFPIQYYVYRVTPSADRAQFEVRNPSGDVNLFVRGGLPLPSGPGDSLVSMNQGASDELISVLDVSAPPLQAGDWFLAVTNNTASPVTYVVEAREFASNGIDLDITRVFVAANSFCITWTNTLPGLNYYVVGKEFFVDQAWLPLSGTLRALTNSITWCIPLPSPYSFFDLRQGLSPLSLQNSVTLTNQVGTGSGIILTWGAPAHYIFGVYYTDTIAPPRWQPYPDYITSTDGTFVFIDDGSKTGGLNPTRFYRIVQIFP